MIEETIAIPCRDGFQLAATLRRPAARRERGLAIINPATGVTARYYRKYAEFLVENDIAALTYDYRGVGESRPTNLRRAGFRWRDWGELDFDATIRWARARDPGGLLAVVGHSIGGFLPGFAAAAAQVDRFLTVGAQYAYWGDYAPQQRGRMFLKWHVAMPLLTAACGYFPGRRLGWLEDLPAGVAYEWSFRGARMERSYPAQERATLLARFAAVKGPILALAATDDEYATLPALRRGLSYYCGAERKCLLLSPEELGCDSVGHFSLFHASRREPFWPATVSWLWDGVNPWPWALDLPPDPAAFAERAATSTING